MMDVNIKHFLFRDGTQVWIAPSFHYAGKLIHFGNFSFARSFFTYFILENRFNGNWCSFSPGDFLSLVSQCTTPIFLYAVHGMQLSQEEKSQLKLFKQLLPSSTVIHFVLNAAIVPVILLPFSSSLRIFSHIVFAFEEATKPYQFFGSETH